MKHIKYIFFDLDHTLWDFAKNSKEAISELYERHKLATRGIPSFKRFYETYVTVNDRYWTLYRVGKMSKKTLRKIRFQSVLQQFGITDEAFGIQFGEEYLELSPYKTALFPYTHELLKYLTDKGYEMHIITNGFEEVQHIKVKEAKLAPYFKELITSESVQARKPNPLIFEHAFEITGARAEESIMIGDSLEADIVGAKNMGMAQIFFNPLEKDHKEEVDYEVKTLKEIESIL
jgi:putative hydrolase of the HAD superfamily